MKHYFSIYKTLLKLNFATLAAYRVNFINSLIGGVIWGIFTISSILLLTGNSRSIYGWSRTELLLFTGSHSIIIGVFHTIFSRNFQRFSEIIHLGQLDSILLKPVDSQFLLSLWIVNYVNITRSIMGFIFTLYIALHAHYTITLSGIFNYCILLCIGLLLLYSIWFIILTFIIWATSLSNLVDLLYTTSGMARFPTDMYKGIVPYVFLFILPITLVVTTPTKMLLHRALAGDFFLLLFFTILLFTVSRFFWKFALRFYTSASG